MSILLAFAKGQGCQHQRTGVMLCKGCRHGRQGWGLQLSLCHWEASRPWASHFPSLALSHLIYKGSGAPWQMITAPPQKPPKFPIYPTASFTVSVPRFCLKTSVSCFMSLLGGQLERFGITLAAWEVGSGPISAPGQVTVLPSASLLLVFKTRTLN